MKTNRALILALLLGSALVGCASADSYQITWCCINSGGGLLAGGSYRLNCSVGQPAAGFASSTSFLHWIGFWAGEVPTPTVAPTINAAKLLADGTFVSVAGKIATSGAADFTGFFYLEERDRSSGIRIACPSWPVAGLAEGSVVNVIGTMGTTAAGERQLTAPIVIITSSTTPLRPLGLNNRAVGGTDFGSPPLGQYGATGGVGLNNVGLLVKTWGRVVEAGTGYVVIEDGSRVGVRVDTSRLASPPGLEEYVSVIGASSLHKPAAARLRLVLPRRGSDIEPH